MKFLVNLFWALVIFLIVIALLATYAVLPFIVLFGANLLGLNVGYGIPQYFGAAILIIVLRRLSR